MIPDGVVADAPDIESAIHLVPVIFPSRVSHLPADKNARNTMKLHRTRTNLMKIMFSCSSNQFRMAT